MAQTLSTSFDWSLGLPRAWWLRVLLLALCSGAGGCRSLRATHDAPALGLDPLLPAAISPSNDRSWQANLAVLPNAVNQGSQITVRNIRRCRYLSEDDYVVNYYDKTFDLRDCQTVDFLVVPFASAPSLAHTMLSFGFTDGDYLVLSVEARLEEGEVYSPLKGALRQYELAYILGDERDLVQLRTNCRQVDVFLYPGHATPEQVQSLLVDVLDRVNQLAKTPEFYDTLTNNCTTNLVRHINSLRPGRIPYDVRVLLPGYSDQLAYELGLIDRSLPFEEARRQARINDAAREFANAPDFSARIRR